jgi:hypothetical protein
MSHEGSTTPLPLPDADFWLDPKTGQTSEATHEIKKVKACRRSAEEPVHFAEIL